MVPQPHVLADVDVGHARVAAGMFSMFSSLALVEASLKFAEPAMIMGGSSLDGGIEANMNLVWMY